MKKQWKLNTVIGKLYIVASPKGITGIYFNKQNISFARSLQGGEKANLILRTAVLQLKEYFSGKRQKFTLPMDIEGAEFSKKVWSELRKIPYGSTHSYKDIAEKIKNKNAYRAVGTANGKNPICIIIPCHRVIAADGSIGGYTGGIHIKKKLLHLESLYKKGTF